QPEPYQSLMKLQNKDELELLKANIIKCMRELFIGQYTVRLDISLAHQVDELVGHLYSKLLTTDTQVLHKLGYDIADEQEMEDITDD
ncbi:MAG: hypothetical protein ACKPKO_34400, partial [Candidatus Fonsibacter sp.]